MKTPDEPRYCITCGKLLVRRPGEQCNNFKRRKTCGNGTKCHHKAVSVGLRKVLNGILPDANPEMTCFEDPRDKEQRRINLMIDAGIMERRGLAKDNGRVLSKAEVLRLIESGTLLTAGRSSA